MDSAFFSLCRASNSQMAVSRWANKLLGEGAEIRAWWSIGERGRASAVRTDQRPLSAQPVTCSTRPAFAQRDLRAQRPAGEKARRRGEGNHESISDGAMNASSPCGAPADVQEWTQPAHHRRTPTIPPAIATTDTRTNDAKHRPCTPQVKPWGREARRKLRHRRVNSATSETLCVKYVFSD